MLTLSYIEMVIGLLRLGQLPATAVGTLVPLRDFNLLCPYGWGIIVESFDQASNDQFGRKLQHEGCPVRKLSWAETNRLQPILDIVQQQHGNAGYMNYEGQTRPFAQPTENSFAA